MNDGRSQTSSFGCVAAAWQAHERELRAFLRRRAQDADLADDVLQDVFVKALREGRAFCMLGNPRAWLFQVARNALVDRFRTSHAHDSLTDDLGDSLAADVPATAPVDALAECLPRTLGELSPDDAAILRACDIEGQTQRAFADAHGLSLSAVKSRLLRARRRLRERISLACQVRFEPDGRVASHVPRPQAPAAVRRTRCILVPVRSSSQAEAPE
jgi:RNA polymerase sigma-70 factor, ECF subfamily